MDPSPCTAADPGEAAYRGLDLEGRQFHVVTSYVRMPEVSISCAAFIFGERSLHKGDTRRRSWRDSPST